MKKIPECELSVLLAELQKPSAYPHPVESVHVVQTHASCVFLTGEYVYKIKKPVRFGFLDYGTRELRHALCQQEVLLNQRLCPEVYLEVVPITWQGGQLRVGGEGDAVEWAVRMRQLRETDMLPVCLQANTLETSVIDRLARKLAQFHRQAHTDNTIRAYGEPSRIADTIRVTLQTMQEVTANTALFAYYSVLSSYFAGFERTQEMRLRQRLEQGQIRDCHGDLRAQNLCLDPRFGDGIQVFDCIEFNPSFRYIDTAADIAYLAMDLDLAGQAALRARLLEVYTTESNDPDLAQILPFYLAYRAMVRGNIALLAARESEIPAVERQVQHTLAARAYALAQSYTSSQVRPRLLITVGFSGSGKSVLARELSCRLPAIYLSSDRLRKEQAAIAATAPLGSAHYTADQRNSIYTALRHEAERWLALRETVILDATFLDPTQRQAAAHLAQERDATFWIIDCRCPDSLIRERLSARSTDPNGSDAGLAVYLEQRQTYEHLLPSESEAVLPGGYILANMTQPIEEITHNVSVLLHNENVM